MDFSLENCQFTKEQLVRLAQILESTKKNKINKQKYIENNREKIKKYKREYYKNKYNTDEEFRLKQIELAKKRNEKRKLLKKDEECKETNALDESNEDSDFTTTS